MTGEFDSRFLDFGWVFVRKVGEESMLCFNRADVEVSSSSEPEGRNFLALPRRVSSRPPPSIANTV